MADEQTADMAGIADEVVETPAEEQTPEGIADEAQGTEQQPEDKPTEEPAKPEEYELVAGDDFPMPEENLKSFTQACRDAGLSKEQAEKVLGWHKAQYTDFQQTSEKQVKDTLAGWQKDIQADADFGGVHWKQTVADARKAFEAFDTDGSLRAMLRETQYQHNPTVIRAVARLGRMMQEHDWIGQGGAAGSSRPLEDRLWPDK